MAARLSESKEALIAQLGEARDDLMEALHGLTSDQLERAEPHTWSIKDVLAHVAMWDEMELLEIRRAVRGGASIFEQRFDRSLIDRWNDVQFRLRRQLPLGQVFEDLRRAREDIISFLVSTPAESPPPFIATACSIQIKHDRDHAEQIRCLRQREGT